MAGAEAHLLDVEVVYARPEQQSLIALQVPEGCTAGEALARSGLLQQYPQLALELPPLAIFGRPAVAETVLKAGDRVELLRPLQADPKERRRAQVRAVRARRQR
jgi:putative ubiquitin-RnfH superfamily antitoxin RatB of RatAB toxin-antitoxin module